MQADDPPVYRSGDLSISPALGQVECAGGASVRLGPVNMKVLVALLERPGQVVSRAELYDAVWGQQIVGEDALTRCISDIRAGLRDISGRADWIETVPKRGYRWRGGEVGAAEAGQVAPSAEAVVPSRPAPAPAPAPAPDPRRVGIWLWRGVAYLFALAVMASLVTFALDRFTEPGLPVVAALPVVVDDGGSLLADRIELELTAWLIDIDRLRVLSRSAVATRPANPFPFFYYEFGARWIVESEMLHSGDGLLLNVALVDARTGIVEMQVSVPLEREDPQSLLGTGDSLLPLRQYIEATVDRSR